MPMGNNFRVLEELNSMIKTKEETNRDFVRDLNKI